MGDRSTSAVASMAARRMLQTLERAPPFSAFPREAQRELASAATGRTVRKGTVLFHEGDRAGAAYVVERGVVRISTTTLEGRPVVFRLAGPGTNFGLTSLLDGGDRSATATAVTDSRLIAMPAPALRRQVERSPAVAAACTGHAAGAVRRERDRLGELMVRDVTARVAAAFHELATSLGVRVEDGVLLDVPLRHEDVAGPRRARVPPPDRRTLRAPRPQERRRAQTPLIRCRARGAA